ncbi:unnamed protein product [Arctogadus glacialis]
MHIGFKVEEYLMNSLQQDAQHRYRRTCYPVLLLLLTDMSRSLEALSAGRQPLVWTPFTLRKTGAGHKGTLRWPTLIPVIFDNVVNNDHSAFHEAPFCLLNATERNV